MNYKEELAAEAQGGNSAFHEFILLLSEVEETAFFAFFEGEEDPSFYNSHIFQRLAGRRLNSFICNGRAEVLKANELVLADGRANGRSLFFIDKDHGEIMAPARPNHPPSVFETQWYSIENYLVCETVLQRFWVERLHLKATDLRLPRYIARFQKLRASFQARSRVITAVILFGRGIDGRPSGKLNLNNVKLDKIFQIDFGKNSCTFKKSGINHLLAAANIGKPCWEDLCKIYRTHLTGRDPATYIRGKYELWFFWKLLISFTAELADHASARREGVHRATPSWPLSLAGSVEALSPLLVCPPDLAAYLDRHVLA